MKAVIQVKGIRWDVEFDHSPEDRSVGFGAEADLCSAWQTGSEDSECILHLLPREYRRLMEAECLVSAHEQEKYNKADAAISRYESRQVA